MSISSAGDRRRRLERAAADRTYNRGRRRSVARLAAAAAVYNSRRWKKLRAAFRDENPLCRLCAAAGRVEGARDVDHRIPVDVRPDLAYEWDNLQALCRACHTRKTAAEQGLVEREPMDAEPPPPPSAAALADGTRVVVLFPPATPEALRRRVQQHLTRWADQVSRVVGFLPTVELGELGSVPSGSDRRD